MKEGDHMRLRVETLNCWGLWLVAKKRQQRVQLLSLHLRKTTADVVFLQEVWVRSDVELLVENAAQGELKHSAHFQGGALGSGLLLLSQHPILEVGFHQYAARGDPFRVFNGDFFAGKGVGWAALDTPWGTVDVFNTHLSANYAQQWRVERELGCRAPLDAYAGVRLLQILELAAYIKFRTSRGSVATIVAGDMNAAPDTLEIALFKDLFPMELQDLSAMEFSHIYALQALLPQLRDSWAELRPKDPGPTANAPGNTFSTAGAGHHATRIDYIWTSAQPIAIAAALGDTGCGFSYSDHTGVRAEIGQAPGPAACDPAVLAEAIAAGQGGPDGCSVREGSCGEGGEGGAVEEREGGGEDCGLRAAEEWEGGGEDCGLRTAEEGEGGSEDCGLRAAGERDGCGGTAGLLSQQQQQQAGKQCLPAGDSEGALEGEALEGMASLTSRGAAGKPQRRELQQKAEEGSSSLPAAVPAAEVEATAGPGGPAKAGKAEQAERANGLAEQAERANGLAEQAEHANGLAEQGGQRAFMGASAVRQNGSGEPALPDSMSHEAAAKGHRALFSAALDAICQARDSMEAGRAQMVAAAFLLWVLGLAALAALLPYPWLRYPPEAFLAVLCVMGVAFGWAAVLLLGGLVGRGTEAAGLRQGELQLRLLLSKG